MDTFFALFLHLCLPSQEQKEQQRTKEGQNLFHTVQISLKMILDK